MFYQECQILIILRVEQVIWYMVSSLNHNKIYKGILAIVYVAFFAVQLFFNFSISDFQQHTRQMIVASHPQKIAVKKTVLQNPAEKKDCNSSKLRLNKRFHPNSIEFIPLTTENSFVRYTNEEHNYFTYQSPLLSTYSETYFLRGPPIIVASAM